MGKGWMRTSWRRDLKLLFQMCMARCCYQLGGAWGGRENSFLFGNEYTVRKDVFARRRKRENAIECVAQHWLIILLLVRCDIFPSEMFPLTVGDIHISFLCECDTPFCMNASMVWWIGVFHSLFNYDYGKVPTHQRGNSSAVLVLSFCRLLKEI